MLIVSETYNLATKLPFIAKEWSYEKNLGLTPEQVTPCSNRIVWWKCLNNHEWSAAISNRTGKYKTGCPYCNNKLSSLTNNLAILYPDLMREWDYEKNTFSPYLILSKSHKKAWWVCNKGHEWESAVYNRTGNHTGCPYCSGRFATPENNLLVKFPNIAKEWHPIKNLKNGENFSANAILPNSSYKAIWVCSKNPEHGEWTAKVAHRVYMHSGCPICAVEKVSGSNNHNWKGGSSYFPYPPQFNRKLKEYIRKRDQYICQLCNMTEVEHIKNMVLNCI